MRLVCGTCSAVQVASDGGDLRCVECGATLREQDASSLDAGEQVVAAAAPDAEPLELASSNVRSQAGAPHVSTSGGGSSRAEEPRAPTPLVLSVQAPRSALDSFAESGSFVEDALVESGSFAESLPGVEPASPVEPQPTAPDLFAGPDPFAGPGLFAGPDPFAGPALFPGPDPFTAADPFAAPEPRIDTRPASAYEAPASSEPSVELVLVSRARSASSAPADHASDSAWTAPVDSPLATEETAPVDAPLAGTKAVRLEGGASEPVEARRDDAPQGASAPPTGDGARPPTRPIPPRPPVSNLRSRGQEPRSTPTALPSSSHRLRADEPGASTTALPPTPFARAMGAGPQAGSVRSRAGARTSSTTGAHAALPASLTGSHAALSLDGGQPDDTAPRTRTGSRPAVILSQRTREGSDRFDTDEDGPFPKGEAEPGAVRPRGDSAGTVTAGEPVDAPATAVPVARSTPPRPPAAQEVGTGATMPPPLPSSTAPRAPGSTLSARAEDSRAGTTPPPIPPTSLRSRDEEPRASTSRAMLPGDRWYALTPAGQVGPYKADEFAQRLQSGELLWTTLVWRHGLRDWRAARRDDLLVMAVAGTLGLGSKTKRLDGLPELLQAAAAAEAPSEWLVEDADGDTRVESWPLAMQLRPSFPGPHAGEEGASAGQLPSVQHQLPLLTSSQRVLSPPGLRAPESRASTQTALPSSQYALSSPGALSSQFALSTQQRLSSVPGSPTKRTRMPGTLPPPLPTRTSPGQPAQLGARDIPTGRFPRSSSIAPDARSNGSATWFAALAFAAGAGMALMSGRLVAFSGDLLGELAGARQPVPGASVAANNAAAAASETTPGLPNSLTNAYGAGAPARASAPGSRAEEPRGSSDSAAPAEAPRAPLNVEKVTRSLPALDELRSELKRLGPSLRRCLRSPASGLEVELTVEGVTGRVGQLEVQTPALTPGQFECVKEGLSDLSVAPFVSSELKYRHRYTW